MSNDDNQTRPWRGPDGHEITLHSEGNYGDYALIRDKNGAYTRVRNDYNTQDVLESILPLVGWIRDEPPSQAAPLPKLMKYGSQVVRTHERISWEDGVPLRCDHNKLRSDCEICEPTEKKEVTDEQPRT